MHYRSFCMSGLNSRTKIQPKEGVFGTGIPQTSGGHSRGYPGPKLRSGQSKSSNNKHVGADIHDPKARTSTALRDCQKLRSEKLWGLNVRSLIVQDMFKHDKGCNFEVPCQFGILFNVLCLVGACLATGDRIFATGSNTVSKCVLRSCACFCLISGHRIMV